MAERSSDASVRPIALGRTDDGFIASRVDGSERTRLHTAELARWVAAIEASERPRWVWADAARVYPVLLAAGVPVERCHDLLLCHAILRLADPAAASAPTAAIWDAPRTVVEQSETLWDWGDRFGDIATENGESGRIDDLDEVIAEYLRQERAIARTSDPGRMRLLLAAESAGALIAAEMHAAGIPWDREAHAAILEAELGERRSVGPPARMAELAAATRAALGDPRASLDSQPRLLRSLHRAGINVASTSRWELAEHDHPAIAPLVAYRRLHRLLTANGWAWLDEWVHDGRFRPVYVPGGVVTGRWASAGGGALQIPRLLRPAVRADAGRVLVSADVAQLEPRVLAAMARDEGMATAAAGSDLYAGIVESGAVVTRAEAKIAVLGAMYGATTGDAGRLVPRLRKVFPAAMALVDHAARTGEEGGIVRTWLGRTSPGVDERWRQVQAQASADAAGPVEERAARAMARDRGRFTRNFVVQGTAAEWSLAWLADLRLRLRALSDDGGARPELVFFLHDEVLVHTPEALAPQVEAAVQAAASSAGRLLFGGFPIDFPLDVRTGADAAK